MYQNCCICGVLSDDGSLIQDSGKWYHVCMDCSDTLTHEDIIEYLEKRRDKNAIKRFY